jgi:hypothetical protein
MVHLSNYIVGVVRFLLQKMSSSPLKILKTFADHFPIDGRLCGHVTAPYNLSVFRSLVA